MTVTQSAPRLRRARRICVIAFTASVAATTASAGLGENVASIAHDREALRADAGTILIAGRYDRHEFRTAAGTRLREYASSDGTVFAVTWAGPVPPDLRTVLASHYAAFVAAARANRHNHHVLTMTTPELVLVNRRLPRGFAGRAFVPASMPAGVTAAELE